MRLPLTNGNLLFHLEPSHRSNGMLNFLYNVTIDNITHRDWKLAFYTV